MRKLWLGTIFSLLLISLAIGVLAFAPISTTNGMSAKSNVECHLTVYIQRVGDPAPVFWSHHVGVLTVDAEVLVKTILGVGSNSSKPLYISASSSSSAPSDAWHIIPSEYTTNGLTRHLGSYATVSDNSWTVSYQFTDTTGTSTDVQLAGLNWGSASNSPGNLFCSDTFTPATLGVGDKITLIWTMTVS